MISDMPNIPELPDTAELEEAVRRDRYYHRFRNSSNMNTGDVIAFYYNNNNILVKRVIAGPGDWVDIDQDGNVFVNNERLNEPYLDDKAYGETNIELPYQVPDGRIFVMGDNRSVFIDSRNTSIGCVSEEQIVDKIVYRVWPLSQFGTVH